MARSLEELINNSSVGDELFIKSVYTNSHHNKLILNGLNSLSNEKEWKNTLYLISIFPLLNWAKESRRKLNIDIENLNTLIEESDLCYFGINNYNKLLKQHNSLRIANKIINIISEAIDNNRYDLPNKDIAVVRAAHGANYPDVSKYLMSTKYISALSKLCQNIYRDINETLSVIKNDIDLLDDELCLPFHNTDILVRMYTEIRYNCFSKNKQIDYSQTISSLDDMLSCLLAYPFDGELIYDVVNLIATEHTENYIAEKLNRSRTFIRSRYNEGINALSMLLWGGITKELLSI